MTALVLDASASVELLLDTVVGEGLQGKIPSGADWWVPEHYSHLGAELVTADMNLVNSPGLSVATIHP